MVTIFREVDDMQAHHMIYMVIMRREGSVITHETEQAAKAPC